MAVAVKSTGESSAAAGQPALSSSAMAGAAYVVLGLLVVALGVPYLWSTGVAGWLRPAAGSFVSAAGLLLVELLVIGVLAFVGLSLAGGQPRAGLFAGVATIIGFILAIALAVTGIGLAFRSTFGDVLATATGVGITLFGLRFVTGAKFGDRMKAFEAQGWFTASGYKPSQGQRVRRATLLGLLGLLFFGIYTLINSGLLEGSGRNWIFRVPFTGTIFTILPDVRLTMPLVLSAVFGWLAYRLVHMPTFAEFLIATEGELNKIAWPTKRSLWQDTIVVLATVLLMTVFLFVVDVAWGKILSHPWVGVLRIDEGQVDQDAPRDIKEIDW